MERGAVVFGGRIGALSVTAAACHRPRASCWLFSDLSELGGAEPRIADPPLGDEVLEVPELVFDAVGRLGEEGMEYLRRVELSSSSTSRQ